MLLTLFIGSFVATSFLLGHFFPRLIKPIKLPKSDKFDLGYIEDRQMGMTLPLAELFEEEVEEKPVIKPKRRPIAKVQPKVQPKAKTKVKPKAKPKPRPTQPKPQGPAQAPEFVEECIGTLVGLGEKKSIAKKEVTAFLIKNPHVDNINDFVQGIFSK